MKEITIYTDGSCLKNPNGPGGWAYAVIENEEIVNFSYGGSKNTTNNRMELLAVITALKALNTPKAPKTLTDSLLYSFYTDSQLVIKCATGEWKRKANLDLWREYDLVSENKKIKYTWVRGHNGNVYNEFVDNLAHSYAKQLEST